MRLQEIYDNAEKHPSVLEIGCGTCSHISHINVPIRMGIDAHRPTLLSNVNLNIIKVNYDLTKPLTDLLLPNSFYSVIGIDIIEHFERERALQLIKECEEISLQYVGFFIPVGNHPQTEDDRGKGNDFYQRHLSTWYPEDLEKLGYKVNFFPNWHNQPGKDKGAMICHKS